MSLPSALPISVLLLVCSLVSPALVAETPDEIDRLQQQIRQTDERLKTLDAKIAESREQKQSLQAAIEAVRDRVGERQARLQELDHQIRQYETRLGSLESQLSGEQAQLDSRKTLLADAIRQSRRLGQSSGLKIVLQHDDPALSGRLNVYAQYVLDAQRQRIAEQRRAIESIETAAATARKDRNWLNYIKEKAQGQYEGFAAEQSDTSRSLDAVERELADRIRSVAELKADQDRLQRLMDELKASQGAASGYFASNKGRYPLPVRGEIEANFGDVKSVGKMRWNGMFITAREKLPVQAVADGEVVFSDWLRGFGMLVILDHGDGFMTLYGGNREVTQAKGAWVEAGATIATVGDAGGQRASGVYFEIRENAKPVDPAAWVSADNSLDDTLQ